MTRTFLLALLCASCLPAAEATPGLGSAKGSGSGISAQFEHDMLVRFHMHENFGMVRAIEHLLVRGRLDDARELARGISQAPDEPGLGAWTAQATRVREQAAALADAKSLNDAIHAIAKLGGECAACHVASGTLPDLGAPPRAPADATTVEARMARHRWATDRMWEGMIGLSDESWQAGLDVLAATPLPATALGASGEAIAKKLQRAADRARTLRLTDRAQAYGDMLVTCADCHTRKR